MKYKKTQPAYAKREKCSVRTIRNWQAAGAPLDDPDRLTAWKASRKNLPPETKAAAVATPGPTQPLPDEIPGQEEITGAPAALRRLEEAEVKAYRYLQAAIGRGSLVEIKLAREGWLEISNSLRRYDLLVDKSRRDSGELFPRAEIERILTALAFYLRIAGQQASAAIAKSLCGIDEPWETNRIVVRCYWEQLLNCFTALATHSSGEFTVPAWAVTALASDIGLVIQDAPAVIQERAKTFEQLVKFNAEKLSARERRWCDARKI